MTRQMLMSKILSVECELTAYRKGVLSIRINFEPGTLIWKESRQWCNNFVRTLSDEQSDELRRLVEAAVSPEDETDCLDSAAQPEEILLTVNSQDEQRTFKCDQLDPAGWNQLKRAIEKLSHVPFRL